MDKITVAMTRNEYKRFLAYKEAYRIVMSIRRGIAGRLPNDVLLCNDVLRKENHTASYKSQKS